MDNILNSTQLKKLISTIIEEEKQNKILKENTNSTEVEYGLVDIVYNMFLTADRLVDKVNPCPVDFPFFSEIIVFFTLQESYRQISKVFKGEPIRKLNNDIKSLEKEIEASRDPKNKQAKSVTSVIKNTNKSAKEAIEELNKVDEHLDNIINQTDSQELKDYKKSHNKTKETVKKIIESTKNSTPEALSKIEKIPGINKIPGVLKGATGLIVSGIIATLGFKTVMGLNVLDAGVDFNFKEMEFDKISLSAMVDKFLSIYGIDASNDLAKNMFNAGAVTLLGGACFLLQYKLVKVIFRRMRTGSLSATIKNKKVYLDDLIKQAKSEVAPDIEKTIKSRIGSELSNILAGESRIPARTLKVREEIVAQFGDKDVGYLRRLFKGSDFADNPFLAQNIFDPKEARAVLSIQFDKEVGQLYKIVIDRNPARVQGAKPVTIADMSNKEIFPILSSVGDKSRSNILNIIGDYNTSLVQKLGPRINSFMQENLKESLLTLRRMSFEGSTNMSKEIVGGLDYARAGLKSIVRQNRKIKDEFDIRQALQKIKEFKEEGKRIYGPALFDEGFKIPGKIVDPRTLKDINNFKEEFNKMGMFIRKKISDLVKDSNTRADIIDFAYDYKLIPLPKVPPPTPSRALRGKKPPPPPRSNRGAKIQDRDTIDDRIIDIKENNTGNKIMNINKKDLKQLVNQVLNEKRKNQYPYQDNEEETDQRDLGLEFNQILDDMEADPGVEVAISLAKCLVKDTELFSVILEAVKTNADVMERLIKLYREKQKAV